MPEASWAKGLLFIVLVVLIWTLSSVLVQYIYASLSFGRPFLLTYLCSVLFVVYLPPHLVRGAWGWLRRRRRRTAAMRNGIAVEFQPLPTTDGCDDDATSPSSAPTPALSPSPASRMTPIETLRMSAAVVLPWFLAQYTYNVSLRFTSITSNTIISTSSSLHTFFFGVLFLGERFTFYKLCSLVICLSGAAVTCLGDHVHNGIDTVWGDAVCFASAVLYGVYTTIVRAFVCDDEACDMTLLFGFVGVLSALVVGPVLFALQQITGHHQIVGIVARSAAANTTFRASPHAGVAVSEASPFALWHRLALVPMTVLVAIVAKGLFQNVLADYLWARSIVLTSPTVATMGLSMTIPAAMLADFFSGKGVPSAHALAGALLMLFGFAAYTTAARSEERQKKRAQGTTQPCGVDLDASSRQPATEATDSSVRADSADAEGGIEMLAATACDPPPQDALGACP